MSGYDHLSHGFESEDMPARTVASRPQSVGLNTQSPRPVSAPSPEHGMAPAPVPGTPVAAAPAPAAPATAQAKRPRVALMGEFSAGKSTLSNLLIGKSALPVNVTATQLPPVWLSYGDDTPYRVDLNGEEFDIDLERLTAFDLLGENSAEGHHAQAPKLDLIRHVQPMRLRGSLPATATISRASGPIWRDRSCSTVTMAFGSSGTMPVHTR